MRIRTLAVQAHSAPTESQSSHLQNTQVAKYGAEIRRAERPANRQRLFEHFTRHCEMSIVNKYQAEIVKHACQFRQILYFSPICDAALVMRSSSDPVGHSAGGP